MGNFKAGDNGAQAPQCARMVVLSIVKNLFLAHCGTSAPLSPALKFPTPPQSQLAIDRELFCLQAPIDTVHLECPIDMICSMGAEV